MGREETPLSPRKNKLYDMKKNKSFVVLAVAVCLIFVLGLGLLLYPTVSNFWNEKRSEKLINDYIANVSEAKGEDYSAEFKEAEEYNKTLEGKGIPDAFAFISEEEDETYMSLLSQSSNGVMGFIKIPKINVSLPIYHTTEKSVLEKGVGHLQGSALPVGGRGTHCVLSAHRGLPSAALFTDLDLLSEGDRFFIYVLDRALAYEVDQILEVEPDETESLDVSGDGDLVTLVTCTPYGVNSHRLLVRGHRVEYTESDVAEAKKNAVGSLYTNYTLWLTVSAAFTVVFVVSMILFIKKRKPVEDGTDRKKTDRSGGQRQ